MMDADDLARYLALAAEARARSSAGFDTPDYAAIQLADAVEALAAALNDALTRLSVCSEEYDKTRQALTLCIAQRDHARTWALFHANAACYFAADSAGLEGTIKRPVTPDIPRKAADGWGI